LDGDVALIGVEEELSEARVAGDGGSLLDGEGIIG